MDQTQDSAANGTGEAGQPTPPASGTAAGQPNSAGGLSLSPELKAYLDQEVDRRVQSTKDRRIQSLEKQVVDLADFQRRYEALRSKDVAPDVALAQVQRDIQIDQLLSGSQAVPQAAPQVVGNDQGTQADDATLTLLKALDLKTEDPQVADIIRTKAGPDRINALGNLKISRATAPPPSPASIPAPTGGSAGGSNGRDISKIDDPKELYKIAAAEIAEKVRR